MVVEEAPLRGVDTWSLLNMDSFVRTETRVMDGSGEQLGGGGLTSSEQTMKTGGLFATGFHPGSSREDGWGDARADLGAVTPGCIHLEAERIGVSGELEMNWMAIWRCGG